MDYGNIELKKFNEIMEIPPRLCAGAALAHCFIMYGINLVHDDPTTNGYEEVHINVVFKKLMLACILFYVIQHCINIIFSYTRGVQRMC